MKEKGGYVDREKNKTSCTFVIKSLDGIRCEKQ